MPAPTMSGGVLAFYEALKSPRSQAGGNRAVSATINSASPSTCLHRDIDPAPRRKMRNFIIQQIGDGAM